MTVSKAPGGATASLIQNSVLVDAAKLDSWINMISAMVPRLAPTDGLDLLQIACEMLQTEIAGTMTPTPAGRTLLDVDADLAALDIKVRALKEKRLGIHEFVPMDSLTREYDRLMLERGDLLLRQRGVSPEDLGVISLAAFDRREGRSKPRRELVIEFDGTRYRATAHASTLEELKRNIEKVAQP